MAIIETIVAQHAEEAAFLWLLRDAAIAAPHYSLEDLAELDERLEAHIDGLRVAGDEGWPFCLEGLGFEESGEVFAAAVIALEGEHRERIEAVYSVVEAAPDTARGLISAIGWIPAERLQGKVTGLLSSASPFWRRIGIAACAVHRVDCGRHLTGAIEDPDAALRARALRAAGEVARQDLLPAIRGQLSSEDEACAFWAAWSLVLLGNRTDGGSALKYIAMSDSPFAARALHTLVRILPPPESRDLLAGIARDPERQRDLICACGAVGDPVYIPWLIQRMSTEPGLARLAGEAFSSITGVDIAYEDLEAEWPEGFEAGPTDNAEDEDVALDPDEDLPWPDPEHIQGWWDNNQQRFDMGGRYLLGGQISDKHCRNVLRTGMQRQRIAAALELSLMDRRTALFETRAPGGRQQRRLSPQR